MRRLARFLPLVSLAVLAAAALLLRSHLEIEWSLDSVRGFVTGLGWWGPIVFVGLLAFRIVLLLPSKLLLLVGGVCFGALEGSLYGALGLTLSAVLVFAFTRWLGAEYVRSQVPARARRALELAGGRGGAGLMALGTGYPMGPLTAYHVGAALTAMSFATFLIAAAAGSAVRSSIISWFGDVLATRTPLEIFAVTLLFGVLFLPLLHPRARAWLQVRMGETAADTGDAASEARRSAPSPPGDRRE